MNYERELEKIGLNQNEAKIYLAGLKLGPTQILKLSKTTKIKRTNTYALVSKLMKIGLFKIEINGFKKYYIAEEPKKLQNIINHKTDNLIKSLETNITTNQNLNLKQIIYYKGIEGMKTAYNSMLENLKPKNFYYVFSETTRWLQTDEIFFKNFLKRRAKLNLDLKLILTDTPEGKYCLKFQKNYKQQVKILPPETKLDMNLVINPHKILLHKLTEPRLTIITESPEAATMQKQMFEGMWEAI